MGSDERVGSGERVVGGWLLEERLGAGGYGEVWRARRRHVDLVRAVKLIPLVDDGAFDSWRHEIGRLEALNHPNVVRFYDADLVSEGPYEGYAWIATELCERSLADGLRMRESHVLSGAEGERLVDAMLAALAAAHGAGMVHRDIKPANILWHRDGTWKLCDFGTARLVPADGTAPITRVIGTSPYMSPTAIRGRQNQAADLYGLGVTIHEALRGQRLHPRPEGISDGEYIQLVLEKPPTISAELPRRWQTVVATLIGEHSQLDAAQLRTWFEKTRGDRPPSPDGKDDDAKAAATSAPAATSAAAGAAAAAAAAAQRGSRPPVKVSGPMAPKQSRRERNGRGKTAAATGRTELAAQARKRADPAVAPPSPLPGRVYVPAPNPQSAPAAVSPPPNAAAGPVSPPVVAARPAAPPSPWPAQAPAAPDPTAVMGRRIFATVVDGIALLALAAAFFAVFVVALYDKTGIPQGADGPGEACAFLAGEFESCVRLGDDIYVSSTRSISFTPFAIGAVLLVLVLIQGSTGATPGKVLAGLRVIGPDGRPPGALRALLRTLLLVIDGFPWVVPLLGWHLARTTPHHRRLGDIAAKTFVVRRTYTRTR